MIQTIILIIFQIGAIYLTYERVKPIVADLTLKKILTVLYIGGFMCPLVEESIFRGTLKEYFKTYSYPNMITSVLFGLYHMNNYLVNSDIKTLTYQVVSTTYLGYYMGQFDNLLHSIIFHALYNVSIMMSAYLLAYYWSEPDRPCQIVNHNLLDFYNCIHCPEKARDDFDLDKKVILRCPLSGYKNISEKKLSKDMLERRKKLCDIERKRNLIYLS
jgi:hypothetical protein